MTDLTNVPPGRGYPDLLTTTNENQGLSVTLQPVQDGRGISSPMWIATNAVNFTRISGSTFQLDTIPLTANAAVINQLCSLTAPTFFASVPLALPKGDTDQRDIVDPPTDGLIFYNTQTSQLQVYSGGTWNAVTLTPVA